MRKVILFMSLVAIVSLPLSIRAELLLSDDFNYEVGGLYGNGNWVRYGMHAADPIQIVDDPLIYTGYQSSAVGKAVKISSSSTTGEDLQKAFKVQKEGIFYVSALLKVSQTGTNYFLTLCDSVSNKVVADGVSGIEKVRLLVTAGSTVDKFKFEVARGSASTMKSNDEFNLNQVYLVVLKYEFLNSFGTDDKITLFVNPVVTNAEPSSYTLLLDGTDMGSDISIRGVNAIQIKQGTTSTKTSPHVIIDAIRIGNSWADIMNLSQPPLSASISASPSQFDLGMILLGNEISSSFTVKGSNLQGDISLVSDQNESVVTFSPATISKEAAESVEGQQVDVTVKGASAGASGATITLSSATATDLKVQLTWTTADVVECANIEALRAAFISNAEGNDERNLRVTGRVAISHIYENNGTKMAFIQDASGAITVKDAYNMISSTYVAGDIIMDFVGQLQMSFGLLSFLPIVDLGSVIAHESVLPIVTTLISLKANPSDYEARLVKVDGVTLNGTGVFTVGSPIAMVQEGTTGCNLRVLPGVNFVGMDIPSEVVNITGVATATNGSIVAPRSLSDIELQGTATDYNKPILDVLVWSASNTLFVNGITNQSVMVYDVMGKLISEQKGEEDKIRMILPNGIYVVKVGEQVFKVAIK